MKYPQKQTAVFAMSVLFSIPAFGIAPLRFPETDKRLDTASVRTEEGDLIISTGKITRRWNLNPQGLKTVLLEDLRSGKNWADAAGSAQTDWSIPGAEGTCRLVSLEVRKSDDGGFTSPHLETAVIFEYPSGPVLLQYVIWAYPNAPGLRTQIRLKRIGPDPEAAEQPVKHPVIERTEGSGFIQRNGLNAADPWFCSMDLHDTTISYILRDLAGGPCILGFSWWDFGGGGRRQQLRAASLDREAEVLLVPPAALPAWKRKEQKPDEKTVPIPPEVIVGNTFRLFVDNLKGPNANLSEIWLYEKSESGNPPILIGPPGRLAELAARAPEGFCLTAYYDAGETIESEAPRTESSGRVDLLPVDCSETNRRYIGYYNDTQNRNRPDTPILEEQVKTDPMEKAETIDWASIACLENTSGGLMMLKESHKCPNQSGVLTGAFISSADGLANTGTGLRPEEIKADRYRWCWASWTIVYDGSGPGRQLLLKQFDRLRYPVLPERDMWSLVCTWGHSRNQRDGRNCAIEKEILRTMDLTAEMGVDMLLIDDGWQISLEARNPTPDGGIGWKPHPSNYPDGWKNVNEKKKELGLLIGLWGIAQEMPVEDMKWNWDHLGMRQLKLDFAAFNSHADLEEMMNCAREFILYARQGCVMSWDTTERAARYGYWWAREYGNVHFMNRKPENPPAVIYVPWLALRDFWLLSKYQNLNKWQLTIHNPEVVDQKYSDAYKHSPTYCVATALMGIPQFFALPQFYSDPARREIRTLLDLYKRHRLEIFTDFILPIGQQPDNASWTGFQAVHPDRPHGYLLIFRELNNADPKQEVQLEGLAGKTIRLENLRTGQKRTVAVSAEGKAEFAIQKPADFLFLRYEIR